MKMKSVFVLALFVASAATQAFGFSWTVNGIAATNTGGRNYAVTLAPGATSATVFCDPTGVSGDHTYMRYTFNNSLNLADVPGWWTVPQDQPQTYWTGSGSWEWRPPQNMQVTISGFSQGTWRVIVEGGNYDWTQSYVLTVTVPGNNAPTVAWVQNPGSAYINQWFPVQARGNDSNGNLTNLFVWKEWVPYAFNGGGNGWESYSDPNQTYGTAIGTITFQAQAQDSNNATSAVIYHGVSILNRDPSLTMTFLDGSKNALPINGNGRAQIVANSAFYIRVTGSDPDGNINQLYSRINKPDGSAHAYEQIGATSWDFGPYNTGSYPGVWNAWAHVTDTAAGAYQWQGGGWWGTDSPDLEVTNVPPSGVFTINGSASDTSVDFGRTVTIASSVNDTDGNLSVHSFWWDQGSGLTWTHPVLTWNYPPDQTGWSNLNIGANGYDSLGGASSAKSFSFTANRVATFSFHSAASDGIAWVGLGSSVINITINRVTPSATFSAKNFASSHLLSTADLNASFTNPYSGAVAAPGGTVTYSIAPGSPSGTVGSAVVLNTTLAIGNYTIRASYPGDANYYDTTVDAVFTVTGDPNADPDNDGIPNSTEDTLGTNKNVYNSPNDANNATTQLKVHTP